MGTKLFLAITTLFIAFAIMPFFNEVLEELIGEFLISRYGWAGDDYRTAFWRFYPLVIGGYVFVILPLQILASGAFRRRGGGDDINRPPQ